MKGETFPGDRDFLRQRIVGGVRIASMYNSVLALFRWRPEMEGYLRMRVLITEIAEGYAFQCVSFSLLTLGEYDPEGYGSVLVVLLRRCL